MKMSTHFARRGAKLLRQLFEAELGLRRNHLECAACEHVGSSARPLRRTPAEPEDPLPQLRYGLGGAGTIERSRGAIEHVRELVLREADMKRDDRFTRGAQNFSGERSVEADGVEIQIGGSVEQDVILAGGESQQLAGAHSNAACTHPERRRATYHHIQLGLGVEVTRAPAALGLRVLPHEGLLTGMWEKRLKKRSRGCHDHAPVTYSARVNLASCSFPKKREVVAPRTSYTFRHESPR